MAIAKQNKKQANATIASLAPTWRKPISLASFDDEDPLETLYRGREVPREELAAGKDDSVRAEAVAEAFKPATEKVEKRQPKSVKHNKPERAAKKSAQKTVNLSDEREDAAGDNTEEVVAKPFTADELKKILRIRNQFFRYTDIQEILRGKSLDIYSYLRLLSGETGFCKIKHLDLMRKLDISRPTLFKQEEWLMRLRLIEKSDVPGDHLGTSYIVHRLEEVLPVPRTIIKQLHSHMESLNRDS